MWPISLLLMFYNYKLRQIDEELSFTQRWLWSHTSDHSAVNHRLQVVQHIVRTPTALQFIFSEEGLLQPFIKQHDDLRDAPLNNEEMIIVFIDYLLQESRRTLHERPGAESLWIHHKHLFLLANEQLKLLLLSDSTPLLLGKYLCQTYGISPINEKLEVRGTLTYNQVYFLFLLLNI